MYTPFMLVLVAVLGVKPGTSFIESNTIEPLGPFETFVADLQKQVTSLQNTVNQLVAMNNTVKQLSTSVTSLTSQFAALNRTVHHPIVVAFTAQITRNISNIGVGQHIVFDRLLGNFGDGYNNFSGHFTAPVRGIYIFFMTITNLGLDDSTIRLVKNYQHLYTSVAAGDPNNSHTVTHVSVVRMDAGDQVWAQNEGKYDGLEAVRGGFHSSFSGHLITPEFN